MYKKMKLIMMLIVFGMILAFGSNAQGAYPVDPNIVVDPLEQVVLVGDDAVIEVSVGYVGSFTYQWYSDPNIVNEDDETQLTDGDDYTGTATQALTVKAVGVEDEYYYYCVVEDSLAGYLKQSDNSKLVAGRQLGYWPFDGDPNDTIADNDGTTTNTSYAAGIIGGGQAIQFADGSDSVAISTTVYGYNGWTLCWWDNASTVSNGGDWESMVASGATTGWEVFEFDRYEVERYAYGFGAGGWYYTGSYPRGEWTYHVCSYDPLSKICTVYTNGRKQAELSDGADLIDFDDLIFIGNSRNGEQPYHGLIDDLQLYNYGLGAYDVAAMYHEVRPTDWFCVVNPLGDINGDCLVTIEDFAELAADWMVCGRAPVSECL